MFHVPIDATVLQQLQSEANKLSLELNEINSKTFKRTIIFFLKIQMSQGTLESYQIYSEALSQKIIEVEACSNSALQLIMHADELAKDLSHITLLHAKM
jgi:hypothetical protein